MSTQKAKFELFARLQALGFTYEEAAQLRRIEMTLHRWAEEECNGTIQRVECDNNRPIRISEWRGNRREYSIADREAGALRRLKRIVDDRNTRTALPAVKPGQAIIPYHQTDPRGCALYLCLVAEIEGCKLENVYNRGLAVCC